MMQQKMKSKHYFKDRDFSFDDSQKMMDSFRLTSKLGLQNDDSNQTLLLNLIIAAQAKNEGLKTLKAFFKELPKSCADRIKQLQRRKGAKMSHEEQKRLEQLIIYIFIREAVIFFSFIGSNTTQFSRSKGLYYGSSNQIYIKATEWVMESGSKQETQQGSTKAYSATKMQITFLIKQDLQTKQSNKNLAKPQGQDEKTEETQGELIHDYFKKIIREEDRLSILKGQSNIFYIIDQRAILGKGGFGEVCRGQSTKWIKDGTVQSEIWAIKSCKKNINQYKECGYSISQEREHQILMQINKMAKKDEHQAANFIIGIKEVINQRNKKYIVYEYCSHNSLREVTKKRKTLSLKNIYEIALQLAQVLKLIHFDLIKTETDFLNFSVHFQGDLELNQDIKNFKNLNIQQDEPMGIIHRDLKLNNILVKEISQEHIVIKVIDWAFCKRTYTNLKINKVHCGTVQYQAPEIQAKERYNSKVDIWAFGAVIFQLLTDRQFFDKNSAKNAKKEFRNAIKNMQFMECYKKMPKQEKQFWQKMLYGTLNNETDSRWSALELYNHIQSYKKYRPMQEEDFKELAKFTTVKDCLLQHLGALQQQVKRSTRLTSLAFVEFGRLLVASTDFLMVKLFKDKINLQSYHLSFLQSLKPQRAQKIQVITCRLQQAICFFKSFAAQYPRISELDHCISYLVKRYKLEGVKPQ